MVVRVPKTEVIEQPKIIKVPDVHPQSIHVVDVSPAPNVKKVIIPARDEIVSIASYRAAEIPAVAPEFPMPTTLDRAIADFREVDAANSDYEPVEFGVAELVAGARQETGIVAQDDEKINVVYEEKAILVQEWLPRSLDQLEPEKVKEIEPVFAEIIELSEQLQVLRQQPEATDEIQVQAIEDALHVLVEELLQKLDLESDEAKVMQLINLIIEPEFREAITDKLSIHELNQQGTYEYKMSGLIGAFNDLLQDIKKKFHWLGRYSLSLHLDLGIIKA